MALGHCGHGTGPLRAWHWATVGMALGHCGHGTGPLWSAAGKRQWSEQLKSGTVRTEADWRLLPLEDLRLD